jgi:pantoate kinase
LRPRSSQAFAPSAITNFFEIRYDSSTKPIGATGGGYIVSKGTVSTATLRPRDRGDIATRVNGDGNYDARTTRRAVELLLAGTGQKGTGILIDQVVGTPIGSGFGASAAAATSAVYAAAAALDVARPKQKLAIYAHRAEILEQTGLGTVSVIFDSVGAGAITRSGEPGRAEFVTVKFPKDTRLVTGFVAPFDKRNALSSEKIRGRINELGREAIQSFLADQTIDNLASEGERFSRELGLESPEVKKMIEKAKSAGASHASQNMIGYSMHSIVDSDRVRRVSKALKDLDPGIRVDEFEVGTRRAGTL